MNALVKTSQTSLIIAAMVCITVGMTTDTGIQKGVDLIIAYASVWLAMRKP